MPFLRLLVCAFLIFSFSSCDDPDLFYRWDHIDLTHKYNDNGYLRDAPSGIMDKDLYALFVGFGSVLDHGDTTQSGDQTEQIMEDRISYIEIRSLNDFDSLRPAGTLLNDRFAPYYFNDYLQYSEWIERVNKTGWTASVNLLLMHPPQYSGQQFHVKVGLLSGMVLSDTSSFVTLQ